MGEATETATPPVEYLKISIHASRGGSDVSELYCTANEGISIHASRGGSDEDEIILTTKNLRFQSTLPVGEATAAVSIASTFFSISIHASRGGSDVRSARSYRQLPAFQSTLPVGEATVAAAPERQHVAISIHASRGGSDRFIAALPGCPSHFNPRFPWGKRRDSR